jgi:hypothetical protein
MIYLKSRVFVNFPDAIGVTLKSFRVQVEDDS